MPIYPNLNRYNNQLNAKGRINDDYEHYKIILSEDEKLAILSGQ
jgi:hypothetical protein